MEDEEYKKLPLEDRCVHKLWQARKNAYEEATKMFRQMDDEKSPEFAKYLGLVKKFVTDSHAVCQEKGLEATRAFIENYAQAGKTVGEVMSGVVSKCVAAPKFQTRELSGQLILMYIEIERGDAVQEELLKGMEHKNPKIVAACIVSYTTALREFGTKIINVKPAVKKIQVLCSDRDKTVRDEARIMVVEIYRWIGAALKSQLVNLKPVQLSELEAEFAKVEGQKATPLRYIRSEQQKRAAPPTKADESDGGFGDIQEVEGPLEIDLYDLADPVDILSKLPNDFFDKLEAKKWQERKEALEVLEKLLRTPKLENGDYADLVRALKKAIEKDSNVVVVTLAGRCLCALATGLKKKFQPYSGNCISSLLEKFKEKKQSVVTAIKDAIDAVYLSTNLEAISEDVIEALGNKNPSVKAETSFFLSRALTKTQPSSVKKKLLKALIQALLKNINESDPTVRDSSAEAVGTLMKLVGEKSVSPFLIDLGKDPLKMSKIKECCENAVITVKIVAVPATASSKAPTKPKSTAAASKSAPPTARSSTVPKKKTAVNSVSLLRPKCKLVAKKTVERELGNEEVDQILMDVVSGNVLLEMCDANYKNRLAAADTFFQAIKEMNADIPTQALVKCVNKKPGLKDTNFQVLQIKLEIVKYLATNSIFSTTTANVCLNDIMEKFGDVKNGILAQETMTAITESTSLAFVSSAAVDFLQNQKSPKIITETLAWLGSAIKDFGFNDLNAKMLIDCGKKALSSSNPGVRQAAISFCGVLFLYVQNPLYACFENEKAILRDQINAEFDKFQGVKPPVPTKGIAKYASTNSIDDLDEEELNKITEDLFPRVDISNQLNESLLNDLEDKNWKVRMEALTKIVQILHDAKSIKPSLGDLPQSLARRLCDSNKPVAQAALNVCKNIAEAMGAPSKQYTKMFFPYFLRNWGDSKPQLKTAAKETIDTYAQQAGGYKEFFENEMVFEALKTGTQQLKVELWTWLAEVLPNIPVKSISKEELVICIPLLYSHLEDRAPDIRGSSQKAILGLMMHVGYDGMMKQLEKLKPASQLEVKKKLDNERGNLPLQVAPKKLIEREKKTVRGTKPAANTRNSVKPKGTIATTAQKKEEDIDTSSLLLVNKLKQQRILDESKLKLLKWNFTTPREEFVDLLRDQMKMSDVNKNLIYNMFHADFGYHIKALEALMDDLEDNSEALMANLDLILKWLTLRFFDTNPSVVFKALEYLQSVFKKLAENNYKMFETEASSFLPYLLMKIGDSKFCSGVRSLMKQICLIYPVGRVFTYVMDGVKSKNARQRAECLEVMGSIIQDYGISVCGTTPTPILKEVAKQISDKDKSVRSAALNCMVEAYYIIGEKIYKMIGNISGKDLSLLEARIKHSKRTTILKPEPIPQQVIQPKEPSPEPESGDTDPEEEEEEDEDNLPPMIMPSTMKQNVNTKEGPFSLDSELLDHLDNIVTCFVPAKIKEFDLEFLKDDINVPNMSLEEIKAKVVPPKPLDPNNLISMDEKIQDPLVEISIQQMSSPDTRLARQGFYDMTKFYLSGKGRFVYHYENEFFRAIVTQLRHLKKEDPVSNNQVAKTYKSVLSAIDAFYRHTGFGTEVSAENLKDIFGELIHVLVDSQLGNCPDGDCYIRVINLQCVKIIENSNHTRIICALIKRLQECIRMESSARHTELAMKCLWRVIKLMSDWGEEVEYGSVLLEVHNFLKEFPLYWWKHQPIEMPLRTIKTVLHTCVTIKGGAIVTHFNQIPHLRESEVESYVLKILKTMKVEAFTIRPVQQPKKSESFSKVTNNMMLTEIFQKIGNKDQMKEGLTLLYDFKQEHPETDLDPFLKKSSKFFQDYIHNGLREIAETRQCTVWTMDTVKDKSSTLITSSAETAEVDNKGVDYWEQRLEMWNNKYLNDS